MGGDSIVVVMVKDSTPLELAPAPAEQPSQAAPAAVSSDIRLNFWVAQLRAHLLGGNQAISELKALAAEPGFSDQTARAINALPYFPDFSGIAGEA